MPDLTIAPRPGLTVRRPDGVPLAAAGESVTWSTYWERRLADGDIVRQGAAPQPTPAPLKRPVKEA